MDKYLELEISDFSESELEDLLNVDSDTNDEIKKMFRKLRLYKNNEFAILLGVSFTSVNRWENGKSEPTIKVKRKILNLCKENGVGVE